MPAGCAGRAPGWARLPVQYVDYTLWQRAQFGDLSDSDSPIAGAAGVLAGCAGRDARTPAAYRPTGPIRRWPINAAPLWRSTGRRSCSSACAMSPASTTRPAFMVIQAALAVLLSRLSASSDVAVGFPIAGRRDPALDELVGILRQHPGAASRPGRRSDRCRVAGPGASAQPGRLRTSGRAVRGARRAAQPRPDR